MTLRQRILSLTWWNEVNKLKKILLDFVDNFIADAPKDSNKYARQDGEWSEIDSQVVQSVTGDGVDNSDPKNPFVISELPDDFYIAALFNSSSLMYKVNEEFKYIDLQPHSSIIINMTNEIIRKGNDIFITGNFTNDNTDQAFVARLGSCYLDIEGDFMFKESSFEPISNPVHGLLFHNEFLFLSSRSVPTVILKINPYDLTDKRSLTLPNDATYGGQTTDILGYKDKLYIIATTDFYQTSKFIEISEDLAQYRNIFNIPQNSSYWTGASSPFLIYNDELYLPFLQNGDFIAVRVYDLQGNIKRQRTAIPIISTIFVGATAVPHWMAIINNKLLITTANRKSLVRLNCLTLASEETIALNTNVTDDNSITKDGYLILNGEKYDYDPTAPCQLIKVKYNNFTNKTILLEGLDFNNDNGSHGSINTYPIKESLPKNVAYEFGIGNIIIGKASSTPSGSNTVTISDGAGTVMLLKSSTNQITAPTLTTALITSGGAKSLVTLEYYNANKKASTVIINSGTTSSITTAIPSQMVVYKTVTSYTSVLPNPTLSENDGSIIFLVNKMTNNLTLNTHNGGNLIWDGGTAVNTLTIPTSTSERFICVDGTYIRL